MKNYIIFSLLILISFTSCKKNNKSTFFKDGGQWVGNISYKLENIRGDTFVHTIYQDSTFQFNFNKNLTYSHIAVDSIYNGTWTIFNGKLILSYFGDFQFENIIDDFNNQKWEYSKTESTSNSTKKQNIIIELFRM